LVNLAKTGLVLCGLSLAFGLGVKYDGVTVNHETDYNYLDNNSDFQEHHNFDPHKEVNYTGTLEVDGVEIHFETEEMNDVFKNSTTIGYTYSGGKEEIWIKTGRVASRIESICDHERFHEMFPNFSHPDGEEKFDDPIYEYSDDANIVTCDLAVEIALERQNN